MMKRGYGILMPVFSLPSRSGIGDFGPNAYKFADLLSEHGAMYWQLLPLNEGNPAGGESPYFSVSAFAINPLLLSLEKLHSQGLLAKEEISGVPEFSHGVALYDEVREVKIPLLTRAAGRFHGSVAFDEFCRLNWHWLDAFAIYDLARKEFCCPWPMWPIGMRDRILAIVMDFAQKHSEAIRIIKVLQFLAFEQWQELRLYCGDRHLSLIGDMPIYVSLDSADTWSAPGLFKLDSGGSPLAVSGVPPDYFSETGQLWNNPVYNWTAHKLDNFRWWSSRFSHLFQLFDIVRIDHFRGLVQYWEIPAGSATAVSGKWEAVPTKELFDTLKTTFRHFPVICEDLGIITDDVRDAMRRFGFPGMKVLQFAFDEDNPKNPHLPDNYDAQCVVYTGTHDNMPTFGWLRSACDRNVRARIARYTGKISGDAETVWDLIELAFRSNAAVAIVPLQDVLTLDAKARINDPSKTEGNWRWRWDSNAFPAKRAVERMQGIALQTNRMNVFPWK